MRETSCGGLAYFNSNRMCGKNMHVSFLVNRLVLSATASGNLRCSVTLTVTHVEFKKKICETGYLLILGHRQADLLTDMTSA
jgi:hypothetical protein